MFLKNIKPERVLLPYAPVVMGPIILFAPVLFAGKSLYWGIPTLQFIPWRAAAWSALSTGMLPFWNSLNGMGAPLAANYQLALFYPPGWIVYLFQALGGVSWMAWSHTLLSVSHLIFAGVGMIRLMKQLDVGELGQVVSGLSFSLCGYLVARAGFFSMIWAGAWLPWIVLAGSKIASPVLGKKRVEKGHFPIDLVFYIGMLLLSGHAQLSWYILVMVTVWVVVGGLVNGGFRSAVSALGVWTAAVLFGSFLAAVQLVPTAEYLMQSQRAAAVDFETAMSYSFWPWRFLTLAAPDFFGNPGMGDYWGYGNFWEDAIYIGVLPLLLGIFSARGLFFNHDKQKSVYRSLIILCWGIVAFAILFAMGKNTPIFVFLYENIPTFDMFNAPTRYMIWLEFSLALLAGVAAEAFWHCPSGKSLYWMRLATAGAAAVTIGAFVAWKFMGDVSPTFIRSTAVAGLWGVGVGLLTLFMPDKGNLKSRNRWLLLVVLLVAGDLLYASWKINPSIDSSFFSENAVDHTETKNLLAGHRLYLGKQDEYELKFDRFLRFQDFYAIEDSHNIRRAVLPNLNLLENISTVNNFDPFVPGRFAVVVDYVDGLPQELKENWLTWMDVGVWEQIDVNSPLGLKFTGLEAGERVRWINCAYSAENALEAFDLLEERLNKPSEKVSYETVILEGWAPLPDAKCFLSDSSSIKLDWSQNGFGRIRIDFQSDKAGYLLFAETWYPGWKARLDQKQIVIYRADYLFQAVAVPAGEHSVEFIYQPISFYIGLGLSCITFLLLFLQIRKQNSSHTSL